MRVEALGMAYLHFLGCSVLDGAEVTQHREADHEDHEHDSELEVGVERGGKHLRRGQRKGL